MDDFVEFSGFLEALGEGLDDGIAATGRDGRHVKGALDAGASTPDRAFTAKLSAVVVVWRQADKSGDFAAVEPTELGQFGDERGAGYRSDAGHGSQQLVGGAPIIIGFDELRDLFFNSYYLFIKEFGDFVDAAAGFRRLRGMPAIGFSRQHVHELAASSYQSRQFGLFFRGFLRQSRPDLLGETRQEQGIDAIGFGEFANGSCEVANLAGIHHRNRLAGVDKFRGQATLQAAGRLKDNQRRPQEFETFNELCDTFRVVRHREDLLRWQDADIQGLLRDINTRERESWENYIHHSRGPFLRLRASPMFSYGSGGCPGWYYEADEDPAS